MKVTATRTVRFPTLKFGIKAGETKELPETMSKENQETILAHSAIKKAEDKGGSNANKPEENKPNGSINSDNKN